MAIKKTSESPKITDTVVIELKTPVDDCFLINPYKVDNLKIYFVEKNFTIASDKTFERKIIDPDKLAAAEAAEAAFCANPGDSELEETALRLRMEAEISATINNFYYDKAEAIKIVGTELIPAWLSTAEDQDNSLILVDEDEDGNAQFGHFEYYWTPEFAREGDYFICWTWTPYAGGESLSNYSYFYLSGDTLQTTAIPTHRTDPEKYSTLLDRYIPNMYKQYITETDLTPETIQNLNLAISDGFLVIENYCNQIIDLLNANATNESFLPLLSEMFNLKLKSNDPTRWRRQIKNAVPLYKKKGTLEGFQEAFEQAGMVLKKYTPLWQIKSQSTFCESFLVSEGQTTFILSEVPIDLNITDLDNFEISILLYGAEDFIELNSDFVSFGTDSDGNYVMNWIGDQLSTDPIILEDGDIIKVLYKIAEPDDQTIENYIRSLDLMDQRDPTILYPPKNWNIKVIEEDDPLFNTLISDTHPYFDPVIWGQIRTEFAYSENIYNMEEYNGSTRDSTNPCYIDKAFVDDCYACRSSKFNLDLEIEMLTDDRVSEAMEIINEFTPFHAQLHKMNYSGAINEFVAQNTESIEMLVYWNLEESILASGQTIFSRHMDDPWNVDKQVFRSNMADGTKYLTEDFEVAASASGEDAQNSDIVLYSNQDFARTDINLSNNVLEILSPHTHAGVYWNEIATPGRNVIKFTGVSDPISKTSFTYRLSNVMYENTSNATLVKDNLFFLSDENEDFTDVKTQQDVDNDAFYTGGAWQVLISAYSATPYDIQEVKPDGSMVLKDHTPGSLPTSVVSDVDYELLDDSSNTILISDTGDLNFTYRARVELTDGGIDDIRNHIKTGYFMAYPIGSPLYQYEVLGFVKDQQKQFYVLSNSTLDALLSPSVGSATVYVLRRIIDNYSGNLDYRGHKLITTVDYEASLGIMNGANPPVVSLESNKYKENYLIEITTDGDAEYYSVEEWDGTEITLNGPFNDWGVTTTGNADIRILRYVKQPDVEIPESTKFASQPGHTFDYIDRRGNEVITLVEEYIAPYTLINSVAKELNALNKDQIIENIKHSEDIQIVIEYKDKNE